MRSLRQVLGRSEREQTLDAPSTVNSSWNTVTTIGVGAVGDVDSRGVVYPRSRPVSVEVWFQSGDRWVQGGSDGAARQTRVVGLPIIETRLRAGDGDLVQTVWADESGDGRGRIIMQLANETDVALAAAIVVRPQRLEGPGVIKEIRVSNTLVVVDKQPLVELGRQPGDIAVATSTEALSELLGSADAALVGHDALTDPDGRALLAAVIPVTPGVERQIEIVDGREAPTVAPAPLERVVAGWRSHLELGAEFDLPAWPKHLPVSLISSLVGDVANAGAPFGDSSWEPRDDTVMATALAGVGLHWAASEVLDRLFTAVTEGTIRRAGWPAVAAAAAAVVGHDVGNAVIERHGDTAVAIAGETLTTASTPGLDSLLIEVVRVAHGDAAARDAASISGRAARGEVQIVLARLGVAVASSAGESLRSFIAGAPKPLSVADLSLAMSCTKHLDRPVDAIIPLRAAAGTTWRWGRDGAGDSPHARAQILQGLRGLCVSIEGPAVDVLPGMTKAWLGQNLRVSRLPTPAGRLSFALRWHGARAALLWETDGTATGPFTISCRSIDPTFETTEPSGEVLLAEPSALAGS